MTAIDRIRAALDGPESPYYVIRDALCRAEIIAGATQLIGQISVPLAKARAALAELETEVAGCAAAPLSSGQNKRAIDTATDEKNMNDNTDDPQKEALHGSLRKSFNAREEACLRLLIPKSGTEWLDELINEARKEALAERNASRIYDILQEPASTRSGRFPSTKK